MSQDQISAKELRELFDYNPETGVFAWKARRSGVRVGSVAGTEGADGYIRIRVDGKAHLAHRLAWLLVHGAWPSKHLDHINGAGNDNRIANLREVTHKQNHENRGLNLNNSSGYRGVSWSESHGKFSAKVGHKGKKVHVGYFDNPNDAAAAAAEKRAELFTHDLRRDTLVVQSGTKHQ